MAYTNAEDASHKYTQTRNRRDCEVCSACREAICASTLTEVVKTLQGIPAGTMAQTLAGSHVFVWRHVDWWNKQGMGAATDHRGDS